MNSFPWCEYALSLPAPGATREEHRLEHRRTAREELHPHAGQRLEDAAVAWTHQSRRPLRLLEQLDDGRPVCRGEPLQRGDRRVAARALHAAQEACRDLRAPGRLDHTEAAPLPQAAELCPELGRRAVGGRSRNLRGRAERLLDPGHVELLDVAEVLDALEYREQFLAVQSIAAAAAHGRNQAHVLPQAQRGRADAENARGLADGEEAETRGWRLAGP